MPIVAMPDGTQVNFPDAMPPDQIKSMILQKFPDAQKSASLTPDDQAAIDSVSSAPNLPGKGTTDAVLRTLSNVPASAGQLASDMVQPILHPIDTATNLKDLGLGVLQKLGIVSGAEHIPNADAVGKFLMDRYGSVDAIKKTIEKDPVGAAADVSMLLTGGGSAAARLPGAAGKVGEVAAAAGRAANPLSAVAPVVKGAGNLAAELTGLTTGAGSEAIKTAARAGAEGGDAAAAFKQGFSGSESSRAVVDEAKAAVRQLRVERGNAYRDGMANVGADTTALDFGKIDNAVSKVSGVKTYKGQDLSPATKEVRSEITKTIEDWKKLPPDEFHTAEGLDALKQKLGDIRDGTDFGTPARVIADQIYQGVRNTIIDQAPEYAKIMKGYEQATSIIGEVEKTLSLNPKASVDTALRKLQSVLRDNVNTNYGRRAELVDFLTRAGAPHLMEKLAGQTLSSVAPRGLSRVVAGGEGASALGAIALGHPAAAAAMGAGMAASSPALVGGAAYGLGAASRLPLREGGLSSSILGRSDRTLQ